LAEAQVVVVRKLVPWPDCRLARVEGGVSPEEGEVWVVREVGYLWLGRVTRCVPYGQSSRVVLVRRAEEVDLKAHEEGRKIAEDRRRVAQREAKKLGLPMKFVAVEQSLHGDFIRLFFLAPQRVDFRKLVKLLSRAFQARVELRQVGPRDAARMVGGIGVCGRETCCSLFLHEFKPITLKMAFDQSLVIAPQRLTGACGRLRCCLAFEHAHYRELLVGLPKVGKKVRVGEVEGRVVAYNIFRCAAVIEKGDGTRVEVPWEELKAV
jgi:cell fate regulator YaaT (PSP1 superfamily)